MPKVTIILTDKQHVQLERIAVKAGVSKSVALKHALELYQLCKEINGTGGEWVNLNRRGGETVVRIKD